MNAKQKVIDAIEYFENQEKALAAGMAVLKDQERIVAESRAGLLRTLKAVYGERSRSGVVFRGRQYVVREDGATTESLIITNATFEVLG